MNRRPTGVFSAAATPLDADLAPDHARLVAHCRRLLSEGCDGIALLGTTGEANSFSAAERTAMLEAVVAGGIAPDRLLPGTGACALTEAAALTRHALSLGVGTVVMLPPFYYKGVPDDGLFGFYAEVIERVGDPRLVIVLYHIPQVSSVPLSFALIERLLSRYPETVKGIKDSSGDLANMLALTREFPSLAVLAGADPLMLPVLREGGAGCITATSNLIARDLALIHRAFADPARADAVAAAQQRVTDMRTLIFRWPQIAAVKAALAFRDAEPGWHRLRPPLTPLSGAEIQELEAGLARADEAGRP